MRNFKFIFCIVHVVAFESNLCLYIYQYTHNIIYTSYKLALVWKAQGVSQARVKNVDKERRAIVGKVSQSREIAHDLDPNCQIMLLMT